MTASRCSYVLGLATLLTATTVAADTVITAGEVLACSVVWSDTNFTRLKLPNGSVRMLYTRDIRELRLSDPNRTIAPPSRPPQVAPSPDSTRPVPAPVAATDLPLYASVVDTLVRGATPDAMAAKCREMDAALRGCGRNAPTVFDLLRQVNNEQEAIRGIWAPWRTKLCVASCGGVVGGGGGCAGFGVGEDIRPTEVYSDCVGFGPDQHCPSSCEVVWGGGPVGAIVGLVAGSLVGSLTGAAIGAGWRAVLVNRHRTQVNALVRRVNLAIASAP